MFRFNSFFAAFVVQKILEFCALSLLLGVAFFLGSRPEFADYIQLTKNGRIEESRSLLMGIVTSLIFFTFTLYPVITLGIVGIVFKKKKLDKIQLAFVSSISSSIYVILWMILSDFGIHIVPYGIITAIMAVLIFISSCALYPNSIADSHSSK